MFLSLQFTSILKNYITFVGSLNITVNIMIYLHITNKFSSISKTFFINTYNICVVLRYKYGVIQRIGAFKMSDIKATSFRLNDDDIAKFKKFAEKEGYNQAEAFKSIMQTVEMAKAKNCIKDRAKEIEVFQDTVNTLVNMFLNSLSVNQTSEDRIREELSKELQSKDNTIANLHEQLQKLKIDNDDFKKSSKSLNEEIKATKDEIKRINNVFLEKQKNIDKLNSNNDLLQEQLKEFKQYRDDYSQLNNQFDKLKLEYGELKEANNKYNNENELLKNKISAYSDIVEFYKNEISNKDKDIDNYKKDIKSLDKKYNTKIENIKNEYEKTYSEQLLSKIDNLNDKHEVELSRKELENKKLTNEINKLLDEIDKLKKKK